MTDWQPMSTAPRDGRPVLLCYVTDPDDWHYFVGSWTSKTYQRVHPAHAWYSTACTDDWWRLQEKDVVAWAEITPPQVDACRLASFTETGERNV